MRRLRTGTAEMAETEIGSRGIGISETEILEIEIERLETLSCASESSAFTGHKLDLGSYQEQDLNYCRFSQVFGPLLVPTLNYPRRKTSPEFRSVLISMPHIQANPSEEPIRR